MLCTIVPNYHCAHSECQPNYIKERQFWKDLATNRERREKEDLLDAVAKRDIERSLELGQR